MNLCGYKGNKLLIHDKIICDMSIITFVNLLGTGREEERGERSGPFSLGCKHYNHRQWYKLGVRNQGLGVVRNLKHLS